MKHQSIPRAAGTSARSPRLALAAGLVLFPFSGAASEIPVNLVNRGFEQGLAGWTVSGNVRPDASPPYIPSEGKRLVSFNAGNTVPNGSLSQSFAVVPGVKHRVTFEAGTLSYNTFVQRIELEARYGGPTYSSRMWELRGLGDGKVKWETVSLEFLPTASPATITFRDRSPSSVGLDLLLDNVIVTSDEVAPGLAYDFERGFDGWTPSGSARSVTGTPSLAANGGGFIDFNAGNTSTGGSISRTIAVRKAGELLHLSFNMGIRAYLDATQSVRVTIHDGETRLDHTFHVQKPSGGNLGWWPKGRDFLIGSDVFTITFTDVSPITFNVDLLIDDITIGEGEGGMAVIPPGSFWMGSPRGEAGRYEEEVLHRVTLTRPFLMRKDEVDRGEWDHIREASRHTHPHDVGEGIPGSNPVAGITWWDAIKWCNLLSYFQGFEPVYKMAHSPSQVILNGTPEVFYDKNASGFRLPTEAEWEYACRAGTSTAFANGPCTQPVGNDPVLNLIGWYRENSGGAAVPWPRPMVSNDWGLWNMHGNVWEWCWDRFQAYPYGAVTDPTGGATGPYRIARGGGFEDFANGCRSATRTGVPPEYMYAGIGLRIVRNFP